MFRDSDLLTKKGVWDALGLEYINVLRLKLVLKGEYSLLFTLMSSVARISFVVRICDSAAHSY